MDIEEARVLHSDNGGVHQNHGHVHDQELDQGASVVAPRAEIQQSHRLPGVNDGEYDFLYRESDQLDAFEDIEPVDEEGGFVRMAAYLEDEAGGMQDDGVDDDHGEGGTEDGSAVADKMQSRPEDQGLARYHPDPSDQFHHEGEHAGVYVEDDKEIAEAEGDDTEGGDEETPEIAPAISFEGAEAQHDQFQGIVPGNADQAGDYCTLRESVTDGAISEAEIAAGDVGKRHEDIAVDGSGIAIQLQNTHRKTEIGPG